MKIIFIFLKIQHCEKSLLINVITILSRIILILRKHMSYLLANIIKIKIWKKLSNIINYAIFVNELRCFVIDFTINLNSCLSHLNHKKKSL